MKWLLPLGFGLLILAGCSRQNSREGFGIVEGKITFQGKPLTGGSIHFFQDQERVGSFTIRPDGSYSAEIPVGQVKAAIETLSAKYDDRETVMKIMKENGYDMDRNQRKIDSPALTARKGKYVDIPEQYGDSDKSGLECQVVPGRQICNFDLK